MMMVKCIDTAAHQQTCQCYMLLCVLRHSGSQQHCGVLMQLHGLSPGLWLLVKECFSTKRVLNVRLSAELNSQ